MATLFVFAYIMQFANKLLVDPYLQSLLTKALALFCNCLAAFFANGFSDVT